MEEIVYLIILMHFIIVFILSKIKLIFKSYFTLNKMKKLTNNKVHKCLDLDAGEFGFWTIA